MPFKKFGKGVRGRKRKLLSQLTPKQVKHLVQFGEAHPAEENVEVARLEVSDDNELRTQGNSNRFLSEFESKNDENTGGTSSDEEKDDSFDQLVTSLEIRKDFTEDSDDSKSGEDLQVPPKIQKESEQSNFIEPIETPNDNEEASVTDTEESKNEVQDPFHRHFEAPTLEENIAKILMNKENWKTQEVKWPHIGHLMLREPTSCNEGVLQITPLKRREELSECHLKSILINNMSKSIQVSKKGHASKVSPLELELLSIMTNYRDFYFAERTFENGEDIRLLYTIHTLNHVVKARNKVIHHNNKIKQNTDAAHEYRDQGLTRPKVLIVLPFKESALRVVNLMISLLFEDGRENVMNKKRFQEEYGSDEEKHKQSTKPDDFEVMFSGNTDDAFRIGITVTRKCLRLYSDFYAADIILASPLGLRTIIGAEGEKGRDFDFLSSIEILIFDQADIFLMQNWEHVLHLMQHLHRQPKESHGVDFSRVRMWCLDGLSKYFRQTLIFSSFNAPQLLALFKKHCTNYEGSVLVCNPVTSGSVSQVIIQLPQVFQRFETHSIQDAPEDRFNFFIKKILPQFKDAIMSHTMIFVPSYFDFVRLRNYFKREDISFTQICEYSEPGKIAKARDMFFHGGRHFLLYTERCHFYRRYRIKGIRHIIFYELPLYPHFYSELCNFLHPNMRRKKRGNADTEHVSCTVLYSYLDVHQLSGVVGTTKSSTMIHSEKKVHMFVTSDV